jgi:hypothetical protein
MCEIANFTSKVIACQPQPCHMPKQRSSNRSQFNALRRSVDKLRTGRHLKPTQTDAERGLPKP